MINSQENFDKMSHGVLAWLHAKADITSGLYGVDDYLLAIQKTHDEIGSAEMRQEIGNGKEILLKRESRDVLIRSALEIIRKLLAYAIVQKNKTLQNSVNYTESTLKKSSDNRLLSICRIVYQEANNMLTELAALGITATHLNDLKDALQNFSNHVPQEKMETKETKTNTYILKELFTTLKSQWDAVDTLIETVRTTYPEFYYEYHELRKVDKSRNNPFMLMVELKEAGSNLALRNVKLILATAVKSQQQDISKKTAAGGGSRFKNLDEGDYILTATKAGYREINENIVIVKGETKSITLYMQKK
ncbi:MAG: hypothetical protein NTZ33_02375 [Bacteroidetes bacterium]|nr:hypothetical protein [Bacteroidota bacterium]